MISLKTFLPILAPMIGATPAVLYERQRALVRLGLLEAVKGRGPGSGVQLNDWSLAMLIIAYAAADSLGDVERRVPTVAAARCDEIMKGRKVVVPRCPLTKRETFAEALQSILSDSKLAGVVEYIEIQLNGPEILICYRKPKDEADPTGFTSFSFGPEVSVMGSALKGIQKTAHISHEVIIGVADALKGISRTGALGPQRLL